MVAGASSTMASAMATRSVGVFAPTSTMNLQEKLRVAHQLEVLGVDIMEAGFPASSPGDFESVQRIAAQAGDIQVAGLARCVANDIDRCWEAVKVAKNPRIHGQPEL